MTDDAIKAMLDALRAQIDALEVALLSGRPEPVAAGPCQHPEDKREPCGTMGEPLKFLCKACLAIVNPGAEHG